MTEQPQPLITASRRVEACPLCRHRSLMAFGERDEYGATWQYRICRFCGMVFQSPQMNDEELNTFYRDYYWRLHGQFAEPDEAQIRFQERRAENLLALVSGQRSVHRFLDIGCSSGEALRLAQQCFDCDVVGVELSDDFRAFVAGRGFSVFASIDEFLERGEQRVDLVCLSHVLEHFSDPVAYLTRLRERVLTPSGCLLVEVPNLYAHGSFEAAHVCCFTEKTLAETLAQAGYRLLRMKKHNVPREAMKRPLYIAVLCCTDEAMTVAPIKRSFIARERIRRRYGLTEGPVWHRVYRMMRNYASEWIHA